MSATGRTRLTTVRPFRARGPHVQPRAKLSTSPPKKKLSESPWALAILGAILGVIGTYIGTSVSDSYSQAQYWREQRTQAYVAYGISLQVADNAIEALTSDITQDALAERKPDARRLEKHRAALLAASEQLDNTVAPVQTIGHSSLTLVVNVTYMAQSSRLSSSIFVIDRVLTDVPITLAVQTRAMNSINGVYAEIEKAFPNGPYGFTWEFTQQAREVMALGP